MQHEAKPLLLAPAQTSNLSVQKGVEMPRCPLIRFPQRPRRNSGSRRRSSPNIPRGPRVQVIKQVSEDSLDRRLWLHAEHRVHGCQSSPDAERLEALKEEEEEEEERPEPSQTNFRFMLTKSPGYRESRVKDEAIDRDKFSTDSGSHRCRGTFGLIFGNLSALTADKVRATQTLRLPRLVPKCQCRCQAKDCLRLLNGKVSQERLPAELVSPECDGDSPILPEDPAIHRPDRTMESASERASEPPVDIAAGVAVRDTVTAERVEDGRDISATIDYRIDGNASAGSTARSAHPGRGAEASEKLRRLPHVTLAARRGDG
ncbi:hypothetical protein F2P81_010058 [Scophthalmus maximus]|uniref:Uncharacterized protein n=1 Tax=Scophthalmus maximus TaxID=52904 RepID=A0A6A4T1U1_SCOMX|nr:hypothetical protein F2P81_010058 [Scophthalmus maximus]